LRGLPDRRKKIPDGGKKENFRLTHVGGAVWPGKAVEKQSSWEQPIRSKRRLHAWPMRIPHCGYFSFVMFAAATLGSSAAPEMPGCVRVSGGTIRK
jgi:hypothetical protein